MKPILNINYDEEQSITVIENTTEYGGFTATFNDCDDAMRFLSDFMGTYQRTEKWRKQHEEYQAEQKEKENANV